MPGRRARCYELLHTLQDAADNSVGATPVDLVHNIVWDADTYQEMLNRPDRNPATPFDPDTFRCETLDCLPVEPTEAAVSSLVNSVRRVLVDASGVVIDMGRARFFTGNSRLAVRIRTNPDNGGPACGRHNRHKTNHGFTVHRSPDGSLFD